MVPVRYELLARDPASHARLGRVHTPHGVFDTPAFMPVGTQGTIKGLTPEQVRSTGAQCILANTYHLHLRPGPETVAALGGLHRFMGWSGPILTDSGGFQVFSLGHINRIDDDGVEFRSHIDGRRVRLDPESATRTQNLLGADILMAFDQCPPGDAPDDVHRVALERTLRWAERCVRAHARPHEQALFGIVQGGTDLERRAWCARRLIELDLPGYALGGLAVGEGYAAMVRVLEATTPLLPPEKPRYLMGVGFPRDIVAAVLSGVDMFDCVMPTRNGRNAYAFTAAGPLRLRNAKLAMELGPIEEGCDCYACRTFTRGAVRHFFQAGEMLGPILVSLHNIRFYQRLMADLRRAIAAGSATAFVATDPRCRLGPSEDDEPTGPDRADVPAGPVRVREHGAADPGSGGRRAQQDDA